jgi:hypothetical protein
MSQEQTYRLLGKSGGQAQRTIWESRARRSLPRKDASIRKRVEAVWWGRAALALNPCFARTRATTMCEIDSAEPSRALSAAQTLRAKPAPAFCQTPRSKISTMIMRLPQQGHGGR